MFFPLFFLCRFLDVPSFGTVWDWLSSCLKWKKAVKLTNNPTPEHINIWVITTCDMCGLSWSQYTSYINGQVLPLTYLLIGLDTSSGFKITTSSSSLSLSTVLVLLTGGTGSTIITSSLSLFDGGSHGLTSCTFRTAVWASYRKWWQTT